jgi:hypothetical protein
MASSKPHIVFVHGLWMTPASWKPWITHYTNLGYTCLAPGSPPHPSSSGTPSAGSSCGSSSTAAWAARESPYPVPAPPASKCWPCRRSAPSSPCSTPSSRTGWSRCRTTSSTMCSRISSTMPSRWRCSSRMRSRGARSQLEIEQGIVQFEENGLEDGNCSCCSCNNLKLVISDQKV